MAQEGEIWLLEDRARSVDRHRLNISAEGEAVRLERPSRHR